MDCFEMFYNLFNDEEDKIYLPLIPTTTNFHTDL